MKKVIVNFSGGNDSTAAKPKYKTGVQVLSNKNGRSLGFLGENVFYEDTGCEYAKKLNYNGTCLPSKDCPGGCPFTYICLEDVHDTTDTDFRNQKIKELYYEEGLTQVQIANAIGLSPAYVMQIIHDKVWNKNTRSYTEMQNA